ARLPAAWSSVRAFLARTTANGSASTPERSSPELKTAVEAQLARPRSDSALVENEKRVESRMAAVIAPSATTIESTPNAAATLFARVDGVDSDVFVISI